MQSLRVILHICVYLRVSRCICAYARICVHLDVSGRICTGMSRYVLMHTINSDTHRYVQICIDTHRYDLISLDSHDMRSKARFYRFRLPRRLHIGSILAPFPHFPLLLRARIGQNQTWLRSYFFKSISKIVAFC